MQSQSIRIKTCDSLLTRWSGGRTKDTLVPADLTAPQVWPTPPASPSWATITGAVGGTQNAGVGPMATAFEALNDDQLDAVVQMADSIRRKRAADRKSRSLDFSGAGDMRGIRDATGAQCAEINKRNADFWNKV